MLRSRWRKMFREVWARKTRTVMAAAAIFIGVLGVVALTSMGDLLTSQLSEDLKEEELPMQQAFVSAPSGAQLDNASVLESLEDFPGVTRVEGRAFGRCRGSCPALPGLRMASSLPPGSPSIRYSFNQYALQGRVATRLPARTRSPSRSEWRTNMG